MMARPAFSISTLLIFALVRSPNAVTVPSNAPDVTSMKHKLQHIHDNDARKSPDQTPTEFAEREVNAYFSAGEIKLPAGVQSVHFEGKPGVVTATARVDFDQLRSGRNSSNPLLSIFAGVHEVVVAAQARGTGGQGLVQVDSVSLDGVEIPRFVLQAFAEKYLKPKYPNIGLDSRFALPDRIDTASVGLHKLTVTQK
jgi:hypothetical protein